MKGYETIPFKLQVKGWNKPREGTLLHSRGLWAEASPLPGWSPAGAPEIAFAHSCLSFIPHHAFSLPIAALLTGSADSIVLQARAYLALGFKCAKVKVGALNFPDAKRLLNDLSKHFLLRVDVNRMWPTEEALSFFSSFSKEAFEFVEEPVQELKTLARFPLPFALDESVRERSEILQMPLKNLRALVIKPTLTGSLQRCFQLSMRAKQLGIYTVVSSAFESGVGIFHLAHFAKIVQPKGVSAGLGTYLLMEEDVLDERLQIKGGRLYIPLYPNNLKNRFWASAKAAAVGLS